MLINQSWLRFLRSLRKGKSLQQEQDEQEEQEIEKRTTAIGLFNYAHTYVQSASDLSKIKVKATHPDSVVRYNYSHAVELYLKSFLRLNGVSVRELSSKKYGHSTKNLVKKAIKFGLKLEEQQIAQIKLLSDSINDRYIATGCRVVLGHEALHALCICLHNEIGPAVYQEAGVSRQLPPPE